MTTSGLVLTGGASRRLGVDKSRLLLDGETLAARAARLLLDRCHTVVEVGPGVTDLAVVRESPVGAGPLAALVAGARALGPALGDALVLLACDLPWVAPALDALTASPSGAGSDVDIIIPVDETGRRQYVCARYGPRALTAAEGLVRSGERSLHAMVESLPPEEIAELGDFPAGTFADIDVPDDARRAGIDLHGQHPRHRR